MFKLIHKVILSLSIALVASFVAFTVYLIVCIALHPDVRPALFLLGFLAMLYVAVINVMKWLGID